MKTCSKLQRKPAQAVETQRGKPAGKTRSRDASVRGTILRFVFCKKNKVLYSEIFLKPLENPTLITDDSLTFFQLPGSSRQVELLGGV